MYCQRWFVGSSHEKFFQIVYRPVTEEVKYSVRTRVDDGQWTKAMWPFQVYDRGANVNPPLEYERLRSGTSWRSNFH